MDSQDKSKEFGKHSIWLVLQFTRRKNNKKNAQKNRIFQIKNSSHDKETGEQSCYFFSGILKDFDNRDGPIARLTQALRVLWV